MKLWLLRPNESQIRGDDPWSPWYDKAFGFVVRAESEEEARELVTTNNGDETSDRPDAWKSSQYSTCTEVLTTGNTEIIIRDFASA